MKKNIFIVRSPLQIINAIEAKEHFKLKNTLLVMMFNMSDVNTSQMKKVMKFTHWDEVVTYEKTSKSSSLLQQVKFIKQLKKQKYKYLFSGDFGTINQMLISNLDAQEVFLVDDGTATIIIHERLSGKKKVSFSKRVKLMRYKLFGLKSKILKTINFFTCYDIQQISDERIVKNNYSYLQEKYLSSLKMNETTYLLGQNLTEVGCMKDKIYVSYIKEIIQGYEGKIIYIPHRSEIISMELKSLVSINFVLEENHGPIELAFLTEGIYPFRIISFISSALFTLNKIFPKTIINAVKLDEKDLVSHKETIESCYTFFKGTSIQTVELSKKL